MATTGTKPGTGGIFGAITSGADRALQQEAATQKKAHNIYVGLIGEIIGVMVIAVIADMNENVGKLMVTIMVGWLLLFLAINSQWFSQTVGKV